MNKLFPSFLGLLLFVFSFSAFAQKEEPTVWHTSVSKTAVQKGEIVDLIFTAAIKDDWYLYSSDFDKDLGPIVAEFRFDTNDTYQLVGDIIPIGAKAKEDTEIWMGTYTYFTQKAEFRQKIKILKDVPHIKVKLTAQACSHKSGKCIPVFKQFLFDDIRIAAIQPKPKSIAELKPSIDKETPKEIVKKKPIEKKSEASIAIKSLNPENYSNQLDYLKAEKALLTPQKSGEDIVISELKNFVEKYGK